MNHLAHLALAGDNPAMIVGGFLGDFVKGRLAGKFEPEIEAGIRLHRAIDAYTDSHPLVLTAANRFNPPYRRYTGILLDVLFDHLLAQTWQQYYDTELEQFSKDVLGLLVDNDEHLPDSVHQMAIRMQHYNSLANYGEVRFLEGAFARLSERLTRANPIADALEPCLELLPEIEQDFHTFYPELQAFCRDWEQSSR